VELPNTRPAEAVDVLVPEVAVEADLPVPGTPEEREQVAAQLVAGLVKDPPGDVLAVVSDLVTDPLHLKDVCRAIRAVDTAVCTLNGDLGSCASVRHLAFTDVGQTVLAGQLNEAIKDPHNDDALEQLTEAVNDLHEDKVLEHLKEALAKAIEDHVEDPVLPEELDPPWRRAFDL